MTDTLVGVDDLETGLAQYGVLGMKWGKRKKEDAPKRPKPIDAETRAKRNAKAQKYVDRASNYQKLIVENSKKIPKTLWQRRAISENTKELIKLKDQALKDAERKRQGKLTDSQRHLIIGGAIVGGLIATKAIYDGTQSGEFNRLALKGKALLQGKTAVEFAKNNLLADKNMDADQILKKVVMPVNPDYGDLGTKMNCRRATFAYELRRRGFDVKATKTTNAYGQNAAGLYNAITPNQYTPTGKTGLIARFIGDSVKSEQTGVKTPLLDMAEKVAAGARNNIDITPKVGEGHNNVGIRILEALSKEPNGSRGEIGVKWGMGGGHSMAYEVIKGKAVIFDNQTGQALQTADDLLNHGFQNVVQSGFTRLDNVELNADFLLRWVNNATK